MATEIRPIDPARVELFVEQMLDALMANPGIEMNELMSAVYTLTQRTTAAALNMPGVNPDALRDGIARIYSLLPPTITN